MSIHYTFPRQPRAELHLSLRPPEFINGRPDEFCETFNGLPPCRHPVVDLHPLIPPGLIHIHAIFALVCRPTGRRRHVASVRPTVTSETHPGPMGDHVCHARRELRGGHLLRSDVIRHVRRDRMRVGGRAGIRGRT